MAKNVVKCFVSHTSGDVAAVRELRAKIKAADPNDLLDVWFYEDRTKPGEHLDKLRAEIEQCDFLIVALSAESCASEWVQREVGHAHELHSLRGEARPIVIGVCVAANPPPSYQMTLRDFGGREIGTHDFSAERYYKLNRPELDDIGALADYMKPRIRFWGQDVTEPEEMFKAGVFDIYENFWPDEEERDSPYDLVDWMKNYHWTRSPNFKPGPPQRSERRRIMERSLDDWGMVFAYMSVAGRAIGLVSLDVNVRTGWVFGNYFGVVKGWREGGRAVHFIEVVRAHIERHFGEMKGVVFEVERVTADELKAAHLSLTDTSKPPPEDDVETVRNVMRVGLYQGYKAVLLTDRKMRRCVYRQPAMNDLKDGEKLTKAWLAEKEWPLWLMVLPLSLPSTAKIDLKEILDFVYFDLFSAYAELREPLFNANKLSYWRYLVKLRNEALKANGRTAHGARHLMPEEKRVWVEAMRRDLSIKL